MNAERKERELNASEKEETREEVVLRQSCSGR